ncbi:MAG: hypothetical protein ACRC2K_13140 [Clostridium sp.]
MYYETYKSSEFSSGLKKKVKELGLKPTLEQVIEFAEYIKELYKIKFDIRIELKPTKDAFNGGLYIDASKKIIFYRELSLITVLHELRHYIQFNTSMIFVVDSYNKREEEARAWSSSLFYAVFPNDYKKLSDAGCIKFV